MSMLGSVLKVAHRVIHDRKANLLPPPEGFVLTQRQMDDILIDLELHNTPLWSRQDTLWGIPLYILGPWDSCLSNLTDLRHVKGDEDGPREAEAGV